MLDVRACSTTLRDPSVSQSPRVWLLAISAVLSSVVLQGGVAGGQEPSKPSGEGTETFYQQVEILRLPQFVLQGMFVNQQIRYRILSVFQLDPPDQRGHRSAVQTINEAALIEADPLSRAAFEQSLASMPGATFRYELDKLSNVVSMKNHRNNTQSIEVENQPPRSQGFLVSTVIDEDGWKELAQLTLFQPPMGRLSRSFSRPARHDWGALGSWYGKTDFVGSDAGRDRQRYDYKHLLEYRPPNPDDAEVQGALPFTITRASFQTYEAFGEIYFDSNFQRVTFVREVFHAKGTIAANLLGTATDVVLDERQEFRIEVTPQRSLRISQ